MNAPVCSLCGEALAEITQPAIVRGKPGLILHTCENVNCPIRYRTYSIWQHQAECEALRRDICLNWTFEQCLSRPCPATFTAALTLLVEVSAVAPYKNLRAGYCRFVSVCWLPDLVAAAESLMHRCVPVNGADTVNGGWS